MHTILVINISEVAQQQMMPDGEQVANYCKERTELHLHESDQKQVNFHIGRVIEKI